MKTPLFFSLLFLPALAAGGEFGDLGDLDLKGSTRDIGRTTTLIMPPSAAPAGVRVEEKPAAAAPTASAARPGDMPPLQHRSALRDYLVQSGKRYDVWPPSYHKGKDDDAAKLLADMQVAIEAYEYLRRKKVTYEDKQSFVSFDFYMKTGDAKFNPNSAQTSLLQRKLNDHFSGGPVTQADLLFEGLESTGGNMTLALGSLAELFCWNRNQYIPKVADMTNAEGKNYYRFAGAFISLHSGVVRTLGQGGAYANMAGNPLVYAGKEIIDWWGDFLSSRPTKPVDTLKTLGPDGNGNLVDKGGELHKGMNASEKLVKARKIEL